MRAYLMNLRERALLDSDAGMKAADVAAKYRVSGSWVRLLGRPVALEMGKRPSHWTDADHQARAGPAARRGLHGHAVVPPP